MYEPNLTKNQWENRGFMDPTPNKNRYNHDFEDNKHTYKGIKKFKALWQCAGILFYIGSLI